MDAVTLALAKAYTNSQRLAYSEPAKTLTINREDVGTRFPTIGSPGESAYQLVRISDSVMDLSKITEYTVCFDPELAAAAELPDRMVISEIEFTDYGDAQTINFNGVGAITSGSGMETIEGTIITGTFTSVQMDETGKVMAWFTDFKFGAETIHPIDPKYLPAGGVGYTYEETVPILGETTIDVQPQDDLGGLTCAIVTELMGVSIAPGEVTVNWDGTEYKCPVVDIGDGAVAFGNMKIMGEIEGNPDAYEDTGEPFMYAVVSELPLFFCMTSGTYTVSIGSTREAVKQIEAKFVPPSTFETVDLCGEFGVGQDQFYDMLKRSQSEASGFRGMFSITGEDGKRCVKRIKQIIDSGKTPVFKVRYIFDYSSGGSNYYGDVELIPTMITAKTGYVFYISAYPVWLVDSKEFKSLLLISVSDTGVSMYCNGNA